MCFFLPHLLFTVHVAQSSASQYALAVFKTSTLKKNKANKGFNKKVLKSLFGSHCCDPWIRPYRAGSVTKRSDLIGTDNLINSTVTQEVRSCFVICIMAKLAAILSRISCCFFCFCLSQSASLKWASSSVRIYELQFNWRELVNI